MSVKPVSIDASRTKKSLMIVWDDGHASEYSFSLLRAGCPCVSCRGGHDKMDDKPDVAVFTIQMSDSPSTRLRNILPVGAYAITPIWEDGHDSGIYNWAYLRALCPCSDCRSKK
jgi:DUF971 family protein